MFTKIREWGSELQATCRHLRNSAFGLEIATKNFERSTTDIQEIADGLRQSRSQRRSRAERCHYYPGLRPDATQPIAGILSGVYDWPAIVPSSKPSASTDTPSSLSEDLTELMTVLLWLQSSPLLTQRARSHLQACQQSTSSKWSNAFKQSGQTMPLAVQSIIERMNCRK